MRTSNEDTSMKTPRKIIANWDKVETGIDHAQNTEKKSYDSTLTALGNSSKYLAKNTAFTEVSKHSIKYEKARANFIRKWESLYEEEDDTLTDERLSIVKGILEVEYKAFKTYVGGCIWCFVCWKLVFVKKRKEKSINKFIGKAGDNAKQLVGQ